MLHSETVSYRNNLYFQKQISPAVYFSGSVCIFWACLFIQIKFNEYLLNNHLVQDFVSELRRTKERDSRLLGARGWGERGERSDCLMGMAFPFWMIKKF